MKFGRIYGLFALLMTVAIIFATLGIATANHGGAELEVTPDASSSPVDAQVTLTARLKDNNNLVSFTNPGPGAINVDFEVETGPSNADGNTPSSPDMTCSVAAAASTCTVQFTSAIAGVQVIRAWIDHDGENATTESDGAEGRFAGPTDCLPAEGDGSSCPSSTPVAGASDPDTTDVIQVTWRTTPAFIDCDDQSGNDREINPTSSTETYSCFVGDDGGNPVQDVRIDWENMNGPNDGDNADAGPADGNADDPPSSPTCITDATGRCSWNISGGENQTGPALICFWADTDDDNAYDKASTDENDGGQCEEGFDSTERNNLTDVVRKTWAGVANSQLLAEGTTKEPYQSFLLIGNPGPADATVDVTFLTEGGALKPESTEELVVDAGSRHTIDVNEVLGPNIETGVRVISFGNEVVAEMSIHRSASLATVDTIGIAGTTGSNAGLSGSTTWLLPEGATHSGFTTFVDIANPDLATDTQVNITCFPANSASKAATGSPLTVPKGSRRTLNVNAACGEGDDMSVRVQTAPPPTPADSPKPNVVAGLLILNTSTSPADTAVGGSVGVTTPQNNWVVAEGATHSGWHTFVLMANPGSSPVSATVTFLTKSGGQKPGPVVNIPATSRRTIDVNVECACEDDVSTLVTAPNPIAVESSITKLDGTGFVIADSVASGGSSVAAASGAKWLSAEGASHSGLGTFILIANPDTANAASVDVTFLTKSSGAQSPAALQGLAIPAGSRVTIFVNNYVTDDVSTLVETNSSVGVVVEMSIDHITSQGFSKGRSLAFKLG